MSSPKIKEILNLANNRKYFNELYGIYSSGLVIPYIGQVYPYLPTSIIKINFSHGETF